ncbi:hypothetical protein GCM10023088_16670 [Actinomadura verrucosospora]
MFGQGTRKGAKWRAAFAAEVGELVADTVELPLPPETQAKLRKVNSTLRTIRSPTCSRGSQATALWVAIKRETMTNFLVIIIREMCGEGSARTAPGNDSDNGASYAAGSSRFEQLVHPVASRQPPCSAPGYHTVASGRLP